MERNSGLFRGFKIKFGYDQACTWFFVLYMASGLVRTLTYAVMSNVHFGRYYVLGSILVIYFPMLLFVLWSLFRYGKMDRQILYFLGILAFVAAYFGFTLMIHPNYEEYYSRSHFGAYEAVFRPDSGALFGLLAVLASKNTKRLRYNLRCTMPVLLLYTVYQFYQYSVNGYWLIYGYTGELVEQSYNLGFGYTAIFCAIILLAFFWEERKVWQIIGVAVGIILALLGGSRGCLLSFAVFMAIWLLKKFEEFSIRRKLLMVSAIAILYGVLSSSYESILSSMTGVDSRAISMFLSGTFTSDNGRNEIYNLAWQMIEKLPFWGYGAYGDRFYIVPHYYWGYCHHIALEFIIDFGWFVGVILLVVLAWKCISSAVRASGDQMLIVAALLGANAKLFLSDSFWAYPQFWMLIGYIFFVMERAGRKKKIVFLAR